VLLRRVNRFRITPALVVAVLALAIALSGTAYSVSKVSGNSLIKKHSLSGNRVKPNSVTGDQVNESTLDTVPRAGMAQSLPAITFADLSLDPGWVEKLSGGTRQVGYRKDANGFVHLQGVVARAPSPTADVIGTIAPGYRPNGNMYFLAFSNGGTTAGVSVKPDGTVNYFGGGLDSFISLEGMTYYADQ
jgi:hypothetical protein